MSYEPEEVKTLHCSDRRIRDVAYPTPKRREGDVRKHKCNHVSQRELDLLTLIDGHIARIGAEREQSLSGNPSLGNPRQSATTEPIRHDGNHSTVG